MQYGNYSFICQVNRNGQMPEFKGSALRGALGHALRKSVCTVRRTSCQDCLLFQSCLYPKIFELNFHSNNKDRKRIVAPPHPYSLRPHWSKQRLFSEGELFSFRLILFGDLNNYLPYFIHSVDEMGKVGVGHPRKRVGFSLQEVSVEGKSIYLKKKGIVEPGDWTSSLLLDLKTGSSKSGDLNIQLQTPLRMKRSNQFARDLSFEVLVRSSLRRATALLNAYGGGIPKIDYKYWLNNARTVEKISSSLQWVDLERYSSRQKQKMKLGGLVGNCIFSGEIGPFLPLIDFVQKTHLGKQTVFGLGMFDYSWKEGV